MAETIVVAVIVLAAVAWLIWRVIRPGASDTCAGCAHAGSCALAGKGACPSGEWEPLEEGEGPEDE